MLSSRTLLAASSLTLLLASCSKAVVIPPDQASSSSSSLAIESSSSADAISSSSSVSGDQLSVNGLSVSLQVPSRWGSLTEAITDEDLKILRGNYAGQYLRAHKFDTNVEETRLTLTDYPYPFADSFSFGAPTISLVSYPTEYTDDQPDEYQAMTAVEKQMIIDPLLKMYKDRAALSDLIQNNPTEEKTYKYRGAWWGNTGSFADKMGVKYLENADGSFRGVGFFVNEGQDLHFGPAYQIVLINTEKRLIFSAYLPLHEVKEIADYQTEKAESEQGFTSRIKAGYEILNKPETQTTGDLGTIVHDAETLARSISLVR